jgi:D-alanyl-D-alanine carboxypeptidase
MKFLIYIWLLAACAAQSAELTAKSWLIADQDNMILDAKNPDLVTSIASITKVMTVIAVLQANQDLTQTFQYDRHLRLSRKELIELTLVRSDNRAADMLCNNYIKNYAGCIADMNFYAREFNMLNTIYADASGLNANNVSTANDLLKLLNQAEKYPLIVESSKKTKVEVRLQKKYLIFKNTNPLIGKTYEFVVSKTGTTQAAGGCIIFTVNTDKGLRRVVVLGSKNGRTRIPEAEFITNNNN